MERINWNDYLMNIAENIARRSPCLSLQIGAVITCDNKILSTGYNGVPKSVKHCTNCIKYSSHCFKAVHAEINAILQCNNVTINNKTMMLTEFLTITYKSKTNMLEFQFSDNIDFISLLKQKILYSKHRKLLSKDKDRDNLFRKELERNIYYFDIHKRYWPRIYPYINIYFRNIYIIKNSKTYHLVNNKITIYNRQQPKDET